MRCFYVLVHGTLEWECDPEFDDDFFRPSGFHCHRFVLAKGFEDAAEKAFRRVRKNLEKQTGWLGQGLAKLTLEAEELSPAPMRKLLRRADRRHSFYEGERSLSAAD